MVRLHEWPASPEDAQVRSRDADDHVPKEMYYAAITSSRTDIHNRSGQKAESSGFALMVRPSKSHSRPHVRHVAGLLVDHQGERAGQNHLNARTRQFGFPP